MVTRFRGMLIAGWMVLLFCGLAHAEPAGWKLVWADEFDHDGLPDPSKWGYEEGFIRNHESQYYTRARKENARVENGFLIIEGRKEKYRNGNYTSASINTPGKKSILYGRIEVRAKLPKGAGVWPAIWTMGTDRNQVGWPKCGEIDIMEFVGKDTNHIYGTVHFPFEGGHKSSSGNIRTNEPDAAFHVYALEWTTERMDFYFDDIKYHTFNLDDAGKGADNPFRKPHYLMLNLALGGEWGGPIDDSLFPQRYYIDYLRIYEKAEGK